MNFDNYLKWVNDLSNKQFLATANVTYSREQLITYVQDIYTDENTVLWGIFVKDSHIGNLKAMRNAEVPNEIILGILISKEYTKMGIGNESLQLVISDLKENNDIRKFSATIKNDNYPSKKLFTKIGFRVNRMLSEGQVVEVGLIVNEEK
jgi:RimJ/RimL family protein N-acetyltransferase